MEVVALAGAAGVVEEGLLEDELTTTFGIAVVDGEEVLTETGVTAFSSDFGTSSTLASTFCPPFNVLGLSRAIFDRRSVCVPLTAFETVSKVLLTLDMCWLILAVHREAEVLR